MLIILTFCFILFAAVQMMYGMFFMVQSWRLKRKSKSEISSLIDISVIICAKNEAENLQKNLPLICTQSYNSAFEIIVVNDGSSDNTQIVLDIMQQQYSNLKVISLSPNQYKLFPGKKNALHAGMLAAKFDKIILTDADCHPLGKDWIQSISAFPKEEIVLGYGAYETVEGSFLNQLIRWETIHTFMQYSSLAQISFTYMGVGRNLSYLKEDYFTLLEQDEFKRIYAATPSGDDDLIIGQLAYFRPAHVIASRESFTISTPKTNWKDWLKQKQRHVSTGKYYNKMVQQILGMYGLSHGIFWLLSVILGIYLFAGQLPFPILFIVFFLSRIIICQINIDVWKRITHERSIITIVPVFDFLWAVYNIFMAPFIFWKNKKQWK